MRFKVKNKRDWNKWFAWNPVKIGSQWVWWETVEIRKDYWGFWEYRLLSK